MNLFGLQITKAAPAGTAPVRSSMWGWVRESFAGAWQKGVNVDPLGGLTQFGAVYACIARIASDVAKLQPRLMQRQLDMTWVEAPENSPYWITLRKPNGYQNRIQFYALWLTSKLMYGNTYVLKVRDNRNMVAALYILDPRRVTPMVTPEGDVYYSLGGDDLSKVPAGEVLPASEIIHDRCVTLWHPLVGVSPIYACGASATQGIRIQGNSATFFENMSRPSGMLTAPGTIDEVTAKRLKEEWEKNYAGLNIGRLAILGDGLKYEAMTIPANDAQLMQQLDWTVRDVAAVFFMPLYKLNSGPPPTSSNTGELNQQYYTDCLQTHIEAIELCLDEGLGVGAGYGVEFDIGGLLRMDGLAQIEMLSKAVGGAIMKPNEARALRNLPPVSGGDSVYLQEQNYSLEALAKRDALPDPWASAEPAPAPAPVVESLPPAEPAKDYEPHFGAVGQQVKEASADGVRQISEVVVKLNEEFAAKAAEHASQIDGLREAVAAQGETMAHSVAKCFEAVAEVAGRVNTTDDVVKALIAEATTAAVTALAEQNQEERRLMQESFAAACEGAKSAAVKPTDEPDISELSAALVDRFSRELMNA